MRFSAIVTLMGSTLGGLTLLVGYAAAKSAPQEAAVAALACALAVVPYVFMRCLQLSEDQDARGAALKQLIQAIEANAKLQAQPAAIASPPTTERQT